MTCLITSMITDRTGRHAVLLPINLKYEKICDVFFFFFFCNLKSKTRYFESFCLQEKKRRYILIRSARGIARTAACYNAWRITCAVLLHRSTSAEIRTAIADQVEEFCYSYDYIKNRFLLSCMPPSHYSHRLNKLICHALTKRWVDPQANQPIHLFSK